MGLKTANNLENIARYVVKGGNENLRYNAGFGRDLAEDIEAKLYKRGRTKGLEEDQTIEDERGLTIEEVRQLDEAQPKFIINAKYSFPVETNTSLRSCFFPDWNSQL